ncbi:glycosyl hydrolase family 71-domain-containing protein [Desarmillaria ectypa]|nr:glycosyl hydrolase family 71-domain-containing protein [Desarmillaria ectypa]
MKVLLSFDFNWWDLSNASGVGSKIAQYGSKSAQLTINGKVFVLSFSGDNLDIATPNDANNKAPQRDITVTDGDKTYFATIADKSLIVPASPWFSTHFGPEVLYSKNWVFPSDLLWYQCWSDILTSAPEYAEIITWNDYGESHYVATLSSPTLTTAAPNTTMGAANNASRNYFNGRPNGWETLSDEVFAVSLLTPMEPLPSTPEARNIAMTARPVHLHSLFQWA